MYPRHGLYCRKFKHRIVIGLIIAGLIISALGFSTTPFFSAPPSFAQEQPPDAQSIPDLPEEIPSDPDNQSLDDQDDPNLPPKEQIICEEDQILDEDGLTCLDPDSSSFLDGISNTFDSITSAISSFFNPVQDFFTTPSPSGFTLALDSIDSVSPNSGPKQGNQTITITGTDFYQPVLWKQVEGNTHTLALDEHGDLYAWGSNQYGQLGTGVSGSPSPGQPTPVKISDGAIASSPFTPGKKIAQISASNGGDFSLAIDEDGILYAWGRGTSGQLGRGNNTDSSLPIQISDGAIASSPLTAGKKIAQIFAGNGHTFAIDENGLLYVWGSNTAGQFGIGSATPANSNIPIQISHGAIPSSPFTAGLKIVKVTAGMLHSAALDENGDIYTWGDNWSGALGTGSNTGPQASCGSYSLGCSRIPTKISDGAIAGSPLTAGLKLTTLVTGAQHNFVIDENGILYSWGYDTFNQLGLGATSPNQCNTGGYGCSVLPIKISDGAIVTSPLTAGLKIVQVGTGTYTSFAMDENDVVYGWGNNNAGSVGRGNTTGTAVPVKISDGAIASSPFVSGMTFKQINGGDGQSFFITTDGELYAWGSNYYGQVGNNSQGTDATRPVHIPGQTNATPTVTIGDKPCTNLSFTNTTITCDTPPMAKAGAQDVKVTINGQTTTLSGGYTYELDFAITDLTPTSGPTLGGTSVTITGTGFEQQAEWAKIAHTRRTTLALDASGHLWVWGQNNMGALGNGGTSSSSNRPVNYSAIGTHASGGATNPLRGLTFTDIAGGEYFSLSLDENGHIWAWGRNNNGQVGNNDSGNDALLPVNISAPTELGGLPNPIHGLTFTQISAGQNHTLALDSTGKIWAWGANGQGQLGTGNTTTSPIPVFTSANSAISGLTFQTIQAGYTHSLAIASNGDLWVWGSNVNGSGSSSNTPINLSALGGNPANGVSFKTLSADRFTLAIDTTGDLWSWGGGSNDYGQLGDGTSNTTRSTPLNLSQQSGNPAENVKFQSVDTANTTYHSIAIDVAGNLWTWGQNGSGQLGIGDNTGPSTACWNSNACSMWPINISANSTLSDGITPNPVYSMTFRAVSGAENSSFAIDSGGKYWSWGNDYNQFGNGPTSSSQFPINTAQVIATPAVSIGDKPCVVTAFTNTSITCTAPSHSVGLKDVKIAIGGDDITLSDAYNYYSFQLSFAAPNSGPSGGGTPITITGTDFQQQAVWTKLVNGLYHTLALDDSGQLWAWGAGDQGRLGRGSTASSNVPINISTHPSSGLNGQTFVEIATTSGSSLAIDSNGELWTWGEGYYGMTGNGATASVLTPSNRSAAPTLADGTTPNPIYGKTFIAASGGSYAYLAIDSDGELWGWGNGLGGLLGDGTSTSATNLPINISTNPASGLNGHKFKAVSVATMSHVLAIDESGELWAWGNGGYGRLGRGNTADSFVPVNVSDPSITPSSGLNGHTFKSVTAGEGYSTAIDENNHLWVWGHNQYGQLGNNGTTAVTAPFNHSAAATLTGGVDNPLYDLTFQSVSTGNRHVIAVDSSGQVWTWGQDNKGQLGLSGGSAPDTCSTYACSWTPINITALSGSPINGSSFKMASSNTTADHALALDVSGQIWGWGEDIAGIFGTGIAVNSTDTPVHGGITFATPSVTVGTAPCSVTAFTATTINCTTTAHPRGVKDIHVAIGGGTQTLTAEFEYLFDITSVSPNTGSAFAPTETITITGEGFSPASPPYVSVGGGACTGVTVVNSNTLTCTTPTRASGGLVDVSVTVGLETLTLPNSYEYYSFVLNDITPIAGSTDGGQTVTIEGYFMLPSGEGSIAQKLAVGGDHACAINFNGQAYCWGANYTGQIGDKSWSGRTTPTAVDTEGFLAGKTLTQISTGDAHTCALDTNGTAYCWGDNTSGQLGIGSPSSAEIEPTPVDISGVLSGKTLVQISAGSFHTCAIDTGGAVYCWGDNSKSQLGDGTTNPSISPIEISQYPSLTTATQISAGGYHTCTLDISGEVSCWGDNIGTTPQPINTTNIGADVIQISAGGYHTCAISSSDEIYCWGANDQGQLGNASSTPYFATPEPIDGGNALQGFAAQVSAGYEYTCAINMSGESYCWGDNIHSQLGIGSSGGAVNIPTLVNTGGSLDSKTLAQIAAGGSMAALNGHTCTIDLDGQIYCWGSNDYGQLGDSSYASSSVPVGVQGFLTGIPPLPAVTVTFDAGGTPADCAVTAVTSSSITCTTSTHALGVVDVAVAIGSETHAMSSAYRYFDVPVIDTILPDAGPIEGGQTVTITGSNFEQGVALDITLGGAVCDNIDVVSDTELTCTTTARSRGLVDVVIEVYGLPSVLADGYRYQDPPTISGVTPEFGPSGGGTSLTITGTNFQVPVQWKHVTAGTDTTFALDTFGGLWVWGAGTLGQSGSGGAFNQSQTPTNLSALPSSGLNGQTFQKVEAGLNGRHILAIDSSGDLWVWGWGSGGRLGTDDTSNVGAPLNLSAYTYTSGNTNPVYGLTFQDVSAGTDHSLAIDSSGELWAWGSGYDSQLGYGVATVTQIPVNISNHPNSGLNGLTFQKVVAGGRFSMAIDSSGELWTWGWGGAGQLGRGSTAVSSVPINISNHLGSNLNGLTFKAVAAGREHALAIDISGDLWAWGTNVYGNVGNNDIGNNALAPVNLSALAGSPTNGVSFRAINAGQNHSLAIDTSGGLWAWGRNNIGQVGNDDIGVDAGEPVNLSALAGSPINGLSFQAMVGDTNVSIAVDNSGKMWGWGYDNTWQFGISGGTINTSFPIPAGNSNSTPIVTVGSAPCSVTAFTATSITCTTTVHARGVVDVTVEADGVGTMASAFEYQFELDDISPTTGPTSGGGVLTLNGLGFNGAMVPYVSVGGKTCPIISRTGTQITCTIPERAKAGAVDVSVTVGLEMLTLSGAYTYYSFTLSDVTPPAGSVSGGQSITITGTNLKRSFEWQQVSGGYYHTCALNAFGEAYCWGWNNNGQLGNDSTTTSWVPAKVSAGTGSFLEGKTLASIGSGFSHSCALDTLGQVYCWGANNFGQLGDGTNDNSWVPVEVALGGKTVASLAVGQYHNCVIDTLGEAYCWGFNTSGQLGNNDNTSSPVLVKVVNDSGALLGKTLESIAAGYEHTCALDTLGEAYCWGWNLSGQLGNGLTGVKRVPEKVSNSSGSVLENKTLVSISTNTNHNCVLDTLGKAYCWGQNTQGQLGNNDNTNSLIAVEVDVGTSSALEGKTLESINAGDSHTCAIDTLGETYCWGANVYGQLGDGTNDASWIPAKVDNGASSVLEGKDTASISAGYQHTCVIDAAGEAYCWGRNNNRQLGNNSSADSWVPTTVATPHPTPVVTLDIGGGPAPCAVTAVTDTTITCTTSAHAIGLVDVTVSIDGEVHNLSNTYRYFDMPVIDAISPESGPTAGGTPVTITGTNFTQAVALDVSIGGAVCDNIDVVSDTELTCTTTAHTRGLVDVAIEVYGLPSTLADAYRYQNPPTISSITPEFGPSGGGTSLTITGTNFEQSVGWQLVAAGGYHTCALDTAGEAYCWGGNNYGQLGNGDNTFSTTPVKVVNDTGVLAGKTLVSIAAGNMHTCALDTAGEAYCWGYNWGGSLGNGLGASSNIPVKVVNDTGELAGKTLVSIAAGNMHTCALDTAGEAYCWGYGDNGQLGDGLNTGSNIPVKVVNNTGELAGKTLVSISTGYQHACVLDTAGEAYCWGENSLGQLGSGGSANSNIPVKVVNGTGVLVGKTLVDIAAGYRNTCALDTAGEAYCWGANNSGQLGNGNNTGSDVPVKVVNGTGVLFDKTLVSIAAGSSSPSDQHFCALDTAGEAYCWGANYDGQLGHGLPASSNVPVKVVNGTGVLAGKTLASITANGAHTCTLDIVGEAYCWGENSGGQLGDGTYDNARYTPVASGAIIIDPIVTLDIGGNPAICTVTAVTATSITCTTTVHPRGVVDVTVEVDGVATMTSAFEYEFELDSISPERGLIAGGTLLTIEGLGFSGDIGPYVSVGGETCTSLTVVDDTMLTCETPAHAAGLVDVAVTVGLETLTLVEAFEYYSFTVTGIDPDHGPVGGGTEVTITGTNLEQVVDIEWEQVGSDIYHACALSTAGAVYCWGSDSQGQLGNGPGGSQSTPGPVLAPMDADVVQIAVGAEHTCALTSAGAVYCWGGDGYGQLGDNSGLTNQQAPVPLAAPLNANVKQISAGHRHTCALTNAGAVYCWGLNNYGQIGNNSTTNRPTPFAFPAPMNANVKQISAGGTHTCAVTNAGALYCWGRNRMGELGVGNLNTQLTPTAALAPMNSGIAQVGTGEEHTCALTDSGAVYCWGRNNYAQVGAGIGGGATCSGSSCRTSPVALAAPMDADVAEISVRKDNTCALTTSGAVYCWGNNQYSQVGVGSGGSVCTSQACRPYPEALDAPLDASVWQISAGDRSSCAITADRTLYCWGENTYNGINQPIPAPVDVSALRTTFTPVVVFDVDGTPAMCYVTAFDATSITCTTDEHLAGVVDVSVTIGSETHVLTNAFEYIDYYIKLSSDKMNALVNVEPITGGGVGTAVLTLDTDTNWEDGFELTIKQGVAGPALICSQDSNNTLPASVGLLSSLINNTWGYGVGSSAVVGSGEPSSWHGVTASPALLDSADTFGSKTTYLWYGAKMDFNKPSCQYYQGTVEIIASVQL